MILYLHTSAWTPPRRRLALSMACVAAAGAFWWVDAGERSSVVHRGQPLSVDRFVALESAGAKPEAQRFATPPAANLKQVAIGRGDASVAHAAATPAPPLLPFTYVGQWTDGGVTRVVLGDRGRNIVVRVPGEVDGRFRAVSIDENRLVLKDMPLGVLRTLPLFSGASLRPPPVEAAHQVDDATPAPEAPAVSTRVTPNIHVTPINVAASPPPVAMTQDTEQAEN